MKGRSRDSLTEAMKLTQVAGGGARLVRKRGASTAVQESRAIEELFHREMLARRARLNKWLQLIEKEYGSVRGAA